MPALAQSGGAGYQGPGHTAGQAAAIIAGAVGAVVVVAVLALRPSKKTVTGCVLSGQSGMSLVDESDKQTYVLSGETSGLKPGDRMSLSLRKTTTKAKGAKTVSWEVQKVKQDFGACHP